MVHQTPTSNRGRRSMQEGLALGFGFQWPQNCNIQLSISTMAGAGTYNSDTICLRSGTQNQRSGVMSDIGSSSATTASSGKPTVVGRVFDLKRRADSLLTLLSFTLMWAEGKFAPSEIQRNSKYSQSLMQPSRHTTDEIVSFTWILLSHALSPVTASSDNGEGTWCPRWLLTNPS